LASVNIGSSGHHIISQGEADRILNASSKDRKSMIEDALGLKIYQYRIRESEKRLEKTTFNMREVSISRKEIAPHLNFLKKQVEKIEKTEALQNELRTFYKDYLFNEAKYITFETKNLNHQRRLLDEKLLSIQERISNLPVSEDSNKENNNHQEILNQKKELEKIYLNLSELTRILGRLEGMIDGLKTPHDNSQKENKIIKEEEWFNLIHLCQSEINKALEIENFDSVKQILKDLKIKLIEISENGNEENFDQKNNLDKINQLENEKNSILDQIEELRENEETIKNQIKDLEDKNRDFEISLREGEKMRYELIGQKNEINSDLQAISFKDERLLSTKTYFEEETREAQVLIGGDILNSVKQGFESENGPIVERNLQEELRRKIERIKIKLEDAGIGNSGEVIKEYQDTIERDQFLTKELEDLKESIKMLESLIKELKDTLYTEFKNGVSNINKQFQNFFALMFGGGHASLEIVVEHKRLKKDEEMDEEFEVKDQNDEITFERGIEINVSLPHKKVRDLHMLSGGERSLTSIALLFAMSQVNPPPFLVLDETDAALDEANSRKYGNMLENLSEYSQLIVVTHNRETMSRAQLLYGVTIGADGASKLLSVKLNDAEVYAKQ